jgi:hypothetical protein
MTTKTTDQFIQDAQKIHNDTYDYSNVNYKGHLINVKIVCKLHGEFYQTPKCHVRGHGCPKCRYMKSSEKLSKNHDKFIEEVNMIHDNKYDYSKTHYKKSSIKITIVCKEHGDFFQTPNAHLRGAGCSKCSNIKNGLMRRKTNENFIKDAIDIHGNRYDYSKVNYKNSSTKIIIICKEHGEFEQAPISHLNGSNCNKCSGAYTLSTDEFVNKANIIHDNEYDYSKVEYVNTKKKVTIVCKIHGDFTQIPEHHLNGHGCSKCANCHKYTTNEFIKKANEIHGNKYDYSNVVYTKSHDKISIICNEHGEFVQNASSHLRGIGCSKCGIIKMSTVQRKTKDEFVREATLVHFDKYDYSKVEYINTVTKVIIICKIHGGFLQSPYGHLQGYNCHKCSNEQIGAIKRKTINDFIEDAKKIHGDKYDYSQVVYEGTEIKVIIICKIHGCFEQTPHAHLSGQNCSKCAGKYCCTTPEYIDAAKKIYGDTYDYSKVKYKNSKTEISIICKKHGEFKQNPKHHLEGFQGCKICNLCPSCHLWRSFGKLCQYCKPHHENKLYLKTKEMSVVKYLKDNLPQHDFIHNKSVGRDCTSGHLFPDIRFDCSFYNLIVEIDEHEHRGANYKCDEQRMYDIIAKLGLPCIFIRYNPDSPTSSKEKLLKNVTKYLDLNENDTEYVWNDYGFKAEYLFYKKKIENNASSYDYSINSITPKKTSNPKTMNGSKRNS